MILCDTGPIVAAALVGDDHHHTCVDLFTGLHLANRSLLVPATVAAEVGYMLNRDAGAEVEALFLDALAAGDFVPVDILNTDYRRRPSWCVGTETCPLAQPMPAWSPCLSDLASTRLRHWIAGTSALFALVTFQR